MAVTNPYELEYRSLLMGGETAYSIQRFTGLADMPEVRAADQSRLRRHGMLAGDDFLGGRSFGFDVEVYGADTTAFSSAMDDLQEALRPGADELPVTFKIPGVAGGGLRRINARPRRFAAPVDTERWFYNFPVASVEFFATDPRIYDNTEQSLSTGLTASVAGLTWNLAWNLNWGGASTSNIVIATNAGTFPTPATIRFNGPVTNPKIENVTTGQFLSLAADGGLVLGSSEFVVLDTESRTVLLGGTASRYSKLTNDSSWFDLDPGNTSLRFSGSTAGAPTMQVFFRSAWI